MSQEMKSLITIIKWSLLIGSFLFFLLIMFGCSKTTHIENQGEILLCNQVGCQAFEFYGFCKDSGRDKGVRIDDSGACHETNFLYFTWPGDSHKRYLKRTYPDIAEPL